MMYHYNYYILQFNLILEIFFNPWLWQKTSNSVNAYSGILNDKSAYSQATIVLEK